MLGVGKSARKAFCRLISWSGSQGSSDTNTAHVQGLDSSTGLPTLTRSMPDGLLLLDPFSEEILSQENF